MRRHIDKHLVGALCVCIVIAASFAISALMLDRPAPAVEAATQTIVAQPYADGSFTSWTGFPKSSSSYTNIDETGNCNASDYNYTDTASVTGGQSDESYRVRLSGIPNTSVVDANDGSGRVLRKTYRITKIEVTPCLASYQRGQTSSTVGVFYRFAQDANSRMSESQSRTYTVVSDLFQTQQPAVWTPGVAKFSDSTLEVGVRYITGNGGAKVSQLKVKVTYDTIVEKIAVPSAGVSFSKPTITAHVLGSTLLNGDVNLAQFQLSVNGSGSSSIKRIVYTISKSAGVSLSNFRVRKNGVDMAKAAYTVRYTPDATGTTSDIRTGSTGSTSGTGYLVVSFTNDEHVEGSGDDYTLHANVVGAGAGKYVTTSFYVKQTVPPPDADKGTVPPPDADLGVVPPPDPDLTVVPPPDADRGAASGFTWAQTLTGY